MAGVTLIDGTYYRRIHCDRCRRNRWATRKRKGVWMCVLCGHLNIWEHKEIQENALEQTHADEGL
jgi:ribosomal protein L37AE/L43A